MSEDSFFPAHWFALGFNMRTDSITFPGSLYTVQRSEIEVLKTTFTITYIFLDDNNRVFVNSCVKVYIPSQFLCRQPESSLHFSSCAYNTRSLEWISISVHVHAIISPHQYMCMQFCITWIDRSISSRGHAIITRFGSCACNAVLWVNFQNLDYVTMFCKLSLVRISFCRNTRESPKTNVYIWTRWCLEFQPNAVLEILDLIVSHHMVYNIRSPGRKTKCPAAANTHMAHAHQHMQTWSDAYAKIKQSNNETVI
jgi:hypothetical protein